MNDDRAAANTDRELWRERAGDYYADSIHVTAQGAIGINVGGYVYVKLLHEWHKLAVIEEVQGAPNLAALPEAAGSCKPNAVDSAPLYAAAPAAPAAPSAPASEDGPGSPMARLEFLGSYAETEFGHSPYSARPFELTIIEGVANLREALAAASASDIPYVPTQDQRAAACTDVANASPTGCESADGCHADRTLRPAHPSPAAPSSADNLPARLREAAHDFEHARHSDGSPDELALRDCGYNYGGLHAQAAIRIDSLAAALAHAQHHVGVLLIRAERAEEALRAATEDAERLDWLDRDDIEIGFLTRNNGEPFVRIADWRDGRLLGEADTLRAAIDRARTTKGET